MDGLLHKVQGGGDWEGRSLPRPILTVPNVTAHPSVASVPITVLLYDGPLLCGFNVVIKGLNSCCSVVVLLLLLISVVTVRDFAFPVGFDRFLTPNFG